MNRLAMFAASALIIIGIGGAAMAAPYSGDNGCVVPERTVITPPQIAGPAQRCGSCTIPEPATLPA
jgi:hypothetical protein